MKNNIFPKILEKLGSLSSPVIYELPIFLSFLIFTRSWNYLANLFTIFQGWNDSIDISLVSLSIWFLIAYVFASIIMLVKWRGAKLIYYVQLLLCYTISRFCILNFDLDVSPTMLTLIAETNGRETKEFFSTFLLSNASLRCYLEVFIFTVICVLLEYLSRQYIKRLKIGKVFRLTASVIIGAILIFGISQLHWYIKLYQYDEDDTERFFGMRRPANDFYSNLFYSVKFVSVSKKQQDKAFGLIDNLKEIDCQTNDSINIVLIIGESYIKKHSSLYGNPLNTTPIQLDEQKKGNLFAFNDVITPYAYTTMAIKNMMCCNNVSEGELWCDYPYFPVIFQKAGYDVYFWDNQKEMEHGSMLDFTLNSFLHNKKMPYTGTNKHSFQYDETLIDDFEKAVPVMKNGRNLIIFHLQGQHVSTSERFPHEKQFLKFSSDDIHRKEDWLNDEKKKIIADYENATYYNDYVIGKIIDLFKYTNTILLYLSDHGEEVYDYRDKMGRDVDYSCAVNLKLLFDIPFTIWVSDNYKRSHVDEINAIQNTLEVPFASDDICHLLFHLGKIPTDYYIEERDLLSPAYKVRKRLIHTIHDYDKLVSNE